MKLSAVLALTAAVAGLTSFAGASDASSITFTGAAGTSLTLDTTLDYEFTFKSSQGAFRSLFYVPPNVSPAIIEDAPGFKIPIQGDFVGSANAFPSFVSKVSLPFFVLRTIGVDSASAAEGVTAPFNDLSDPSLNFTDSTGRKSLGAKFTVDPDGSFLIAFDDRGRDVDFNDFLVKVRPVPVPAIIPGIALAGAFLGSKALKRKKDAKTLA